MIKAQHIDNGFYRISDKAAADICRNNPSAASGSSVPRHGYERKVTIDGREGWLTRTALRFRTDAPKRGWVWALYAINLNRCPSVTVV